MSRANTVDIRVLDKEYQVSCPPEERDALLNAAHQLDERMRSIRNSGSVIGLERIAVMAALNLSYELSKAESNTSTNNAVSETLRRLDDKLGQALKGMEQTTAF